MPKIKLLKNARNKKRQRDHSSQMDLDGWTQSERESLKWQGERWRVETWSYRRRSWRQRGGEPVTGEAVRERHVRQ